MKTILTQSGYSRSSISHVWSKPGFYGIPYNDGDEVEQRIADIVCQATDITVLSIELRQQFTDWPSLYHLSSARANILRPFANILAGADVLEIGAGCGAITRYLGECGAHVLALEGAARRAAIARSRTRDLPNVEVVADRFDQFSCSRKFDVITLIGVLEYANLFMPGEHPAISMLHRARAMLKPAGKVIIAIENQLGLKYFAGAPEDHLGQAMYGIEGRYRADQPQTYGRKALTKILAQAGFESLEFMAPFPDYKLPVSIITEYGFACEEFDAGALAWQSVRRDPQLPPYLAFSPELVWPTVVQNSIALDLANSFLIVAMNARQEPTDSSVLAYHFSTERSSLYCKESRFLRTGLDSIELQYHMLSPDSQRSVDSHLIKFRVPQKAEYVTGKTLSLELIEIVTRDGWLIDEVGVFLRRYLRIACSIASSGNVPFHIDTVDTILPGACFDLVPQNIIIVQDGTYRAIDKEWELTNGVPAGWLIFRALLLLVQSVTRFGCTSSAFTTTRMEFFSAAYKAAGLIASESEIRKFGNMEATVQAAVSGRPIDAFLNWWSDSPLPQHNLKQAVAERDGRIGSLTQAVAELTQAVAELTQAVAEREGQIVGLNSSIEEIRSSTSWRVTAPLRFVSSTIRKVRNVIVVSPRILQKGGGIWSTLFKTAKIVRNEGLSGVRARIRYVLRQTSRATSVSHASELSVTLLEPTSKLSIIPYYVDPKLDSIDVACSTEVSIAVHLHLHCTEMLKEFVSYLNNIPVQYDLYVSVPKTCDAIAIQLELSTLLSKVGSVVVEPVPNRGRDIAPLIIQFGERLVQYEVIAHIYTKKDQHNSALADRYKDILDLLMGSLGSSGGRVAHIIGLLQTKAKIIFPEGCTQFINRSGWADNYDLARHLLEKYTQYSISDFPVVEFPEGFMFWARTECLRDFLELPLNYSDFPSEPITTDGALAHTLEGLILIFASKFQGQCIRIHNGESIPDYRHYEEQQDYSSSISHSDIKVLSYYLPQFHPIPENDLWHGEGFTEWTKVRAANPLFAGHYQQHIPHHDIGYYLLDSPDVLRHQAELMQQSGVHGQVFYHYWFSGKLILEEPAKLLLDNPDIQMPFCFCWANENWTRRWDGNEKEILLGHKYSAQDAHDFIHYLIPFFRDSRYIKIEDRPVLFVYRPSSIPNSQEYLDIWERECARIGIKRPYVVAVLTRGATNPKDYGMDAGVERVLHDWTEGAVSEIKNTLHGYQPINGSVLPYDEVVDFYTKQTDAKDFTYFRSLVPIWDNTARYGLEAYMLHGSTPQRFQEWMESTIAYTQSTLPPDRRFVLVNAWNEWAEGAHLEPDSRFGYSYLNSVGRALSGIPYSGDLNLSCSIPTGTRVHLSFSSSVLDKLRRDSDLKERFIFCLSRSSVFNVCTVSADASELMKDIPVAIRADSVDADFILEFRQVAIFDSSVIEKMIQTACASGSAVIANCYDGNFPLLEVTANASVHSNVGNTAPLLVLPKTSAKSGYKNIRMRTDARCIEVYPSKLPKTKSVVTTIIRFHKSAEINELRNALYCLSAMMDCVVIPHIAAQDLSKQQIEALEYTLSGIPWTKGFEPQVHLYQSHDGKSDLRSKMLNESLKNVKTRYAAFMDFDDLLMPYAYSWLINRLEKTGKAVSFGRVYSTSYDSANGLLIKRSRVYEYGYSYEEFVGHNHAPLHSFMLDMERLDLSHIVHYEDQRYMEDYLLTLQLFTKDNGDWESLKEGFFIGDYIHSIDRAHTLAFSDEQDREAILTDPEYMVCEQRIDELRKERISILNGDKKLQGVKK